MRGKDHLTEEWRSLWSAAQPDPALVVIFRFLQIFQTKGTRSLIISRSRNGHRVLLAVTGSLPLLHSTLTGIISFSQEGGAVKQGGVEGTRSASAARLISRSTDYPHLVLQNYQNTPQAVATSSP